VCVRVGFVMCGCLYVWVLLCVGVCKGGVCSVWVCVCFVMCGCFGNTCTFIYCFFVFFPLCIFILICFVCSIVRTAATE